jgi:hypothetical protein
MRIASLNVRFAPLDLSDVTPNPATAAPKPEGLNLWIQRVKLAIDVVFFIELGMILVVLPWSDLWTRNTLLMGFPTAKMIVDHGFLRGVVTGLGFINIWIGISDAVNYRE